MKQVKLIILAAFTTLLVLLLLMLTKKNFLNKVLVFIMNIRGTSHYTGEDKGGETLFILGYIVAPALFVIIICILMLNKKLKK